MVSKDFYLLIVDTTAEDCLCTSGANDSQPKLDRRRIVSYSSQKRMRAAI
jgi:hypothetical protein